MSSQDLYPFKNPNQAAKFSHITQEVRCLVCQNQSIADSNAPLANDMRNKVYDLMQQGKNEAQIKTYLVDRYGDYVLFKPPVEATTWILWGMPMMLMLVAAGVLAWVLKKNNQRDAGA